MSFVTVPSIVLTGSSVVNSPVIIMARLVDDTGAPVVSEEIYQYQCNIYSLPAGTLVSTPLITGVFQPFPNKQPVDQRWTKDAIGYNFFAEIPGSNFATAGEYQIEFAFNYVEGTEFHLVAQVNVIAVFGS